VVKKAKILGTGGWAEGEIVRGEFCILVLRRDCVGNYCRDRLDLWYYWQLQGKGEHIRIDCSFPTLS